MVDALPTPKYPRGYEYWNTRAGTRCKVYTSLKPKVEIYACQMCGEPNETLLLCDAPGAKEGTTHDFMVCLQCAGLPQVPNGEYYCPYCKLN